ncbi:MAG: VOC family protein [Candidatus Eisenbacteria bacterium]
MSSAVPQVPAGSGAHPIALVVLSSRDLGASCAFYTQVFGWPLMKLSSDLAVHMPSSGPAVSLRAGLPDGFPAAVPFLAVPDVKAALARVTEAGARVEKAPWALPGAGTLARFTDPGGTLYGLTDAAAPGPRARVPVPFGDAPKPPQGSLCSLEMYAPDGTTAGRWFGEQFGWGAAETMPRFVMFDPGAGISGVFQSHTPAQPAVAYLYAGDVAATLTAVEQAGGSRLGEPMAAPGMATFGYFRDASGTVMGLIGG